jgi:hypothetical protein
MRHDTKVQLGALTVMAGCLAGSGVFAVDLSAQQARHKLVYTTDASEGQPPQVALGIAMGAFRGVFVNFLWMRANELKEAGRHHEAVELAKAITTLQPRFPRAWVFHAWNLAYNISVTTQTGQERWNWVRQGIDLLRGDALKYNPADLLVSKELAWIFLHKIQGITDDANIYYKKMHAKEWQVVLGAPPRFDPAIRTREGAVNRFVEWLKPIAEAPATFEALFAGPEGEAIRELVDKIKANGLRAEFNYETLAHYEIDRAMVTWGLRDAAESVNPMGPKNVVFRQLIEDPAYAKAWPRLLAFVRSRVVREQYHMDPNVMIRYTQKYGPIDWRNPAAHALYWAATGVEAAIPRAEERTSQDFDFVNTDRIVIQAVQELFRTGSIYIDYLALELDPRATGYYMAVIEPNFVDTYGEIIEELRQRSKVDQLWERGYSYYSAGYENFMKDAIRYFYRRGDRQRAEYYQKVLREWPGQNLNDPDRSIILSLPLDEFVIKELWDRQTSPSVAISEVTGAVQGAIIALINQDAEGFNSQISYARQYMAYFKSKQERLSAITADPRMGILGDTFENLVGSLYVSYIVLLPTEQAEIAYTQAPDWLRQYAFDLLQRIWGNIIAEGAKAGGRSFAARFPEPAGMKDFRERRAREIADREANRVRPNTDLK